jgi:MFS family permease
MPQNARGSTGLWDVTFGWYLLLSFLWNVGLGVFPPLLSQIMTDLDLTFAGAGMLGTIYALSRFLVDLPAGLVAERLGVPLLLHGAFGLFLAGTALCGWADSFRGMLAARALLGVGSGMATVFAILYLMRQGEPAHRNRRSNLSELSVIAGMAVSSEAAGLITMRWSWRASFWMATGIFLLAWLVAARRVLPKVRPLLEGGEAPASKPPANRAAGAPGRLPVIYLLIFSQAFAWGGGVATLLPLYGGEALHMSPAVIGRTMAVAFWIEVCLLFPVGWAADVFGQGRVVLPGFLAMLAGTALTPFAANAGSYQAAFVLLVGGMSVWMASPALLAEEMAGTFRGKAAAFYRLVTDLGFILAPGLVGWLVGRSGFGAAAVAIGVVLTAAVLATPRLLGGDRFSGR